MDKITRTEKEIVDAILGFNKEGVRPTYREVAEAVGRHVSQVYVSVSRLHRKGIVSYTPRAWRSLHVIQQADVPDLGERNVP